MSDVELLLCRHQDLEKLLAAQEEKFVQLQRRVGVSKAGEKESQEMAPEGWWWEQSQSQPESWGVSPGHLPFRKTPLFPLSAAIYCHSHIPVGWGAAMGWDGREF